MFKTLTILLFLTSTAHGRPDYLSGVENTNYNNLHVSKYVQQSETIFDESPKNVVNVPDNCPNGQMLVNGACRDIWRYILNIFLTSPKNVINVPDNCPDGQALVNGVCRDIWRYILNVNYGGKSVVTVPPNCPAGQELVNGVCRDIWIRFYDPKNVVTVPPNCPPGQELVNGECRDIWNRSHIDTQGEFTSDGGRNIISIPSQCPAGYKPDANGICREILQGLNGYL